MTSPILGIANSTRAPGEMTADLAQIIVQAIEGRLAELHTGQPAIVVEFHPETQSVDVQPSLVRVFIDENEQPIALPVPVISNVPVVFLAGGGWSITFPLNPGDIVHLAFAERSLDEWLSAQPEQLVTPAQTRKHDLSDAIAIPGLRQRANAIANISATNLRIAHDSGAVAIELTPAKATIKAPLVEIGEGADSSFVRHTEWALWAGAHVHGAPGSPPTVPPPASIASLAKVK